MRPKLTIVKPANPNYALEYKRPDGSVLRLVNTLPTSDMAKKKQTTKQPGEKRKRSVVIPEEIMELLEADAVRCDRTANGQLIAILRAIYMHADGNLHGLERTRTVTTDDLERAVG